MTINGISAFIPSKKWHIIINYHIFMGWDKKGRLFKCHLWEVVDDVKSFEAEGDDALEEFERILGFVVHQPSLVGVVANRPRPHTCRGSLRVEKNKLRNVGRFNYLIHDFKRLLFFLICLISKVISL